MRVFDIGGTDEPTAVSNRVLTVPNVISLARLAALPLIYLDLVGGRETRALVLLAVFAATDWLDGYLARRLNQVSRLGALLDPISDRALFIVVGVGFVVAGIVPLWAIVVLLLRDGMVTLVGGVLLLRGAKTPEVTRIGKVSTFGLMFALVGFLLAAVVGDGAAAPDRVVQTISWVVFAVSIVLHYVSALGYARTVLDSLPARAER